MYNKKDIIIAVTALVAVASISYTVGKSSVSYSRKVRYRKRYLKTMKRIDKLRAKGVENMTREDGLQLSILINQQVEYFRKAHFE